MTQVPGPGRGVESSSIADMAAFRRRVKCPACGHRNPSSRRRGYIACMGCGVWFDPRTRTAVPGDPGSPADPSGVREPRTPILPSGAGAVALSPADGAE